MESLFKIIKPPIKVGSRYIIANTSRDAIIRTIVSIIECDHRSFTAIVKTSGGKYQASIEFDRIKIL